MTGLTQTELTRRCAKCVETLRVAGGENARWLRWELERLDAALDEERRERERQKRVRGRLNQPYQQGGE